MRRFLIAVAAVAALSIGGTAVAGSLDNGVPAGSVHGSNGVKDHSVGHRSLKRNIISCQNFTYDTQNRLCRGSLVGPKGAQGVKGDTGATGAVGAQGERGPVGPAGPTGLVVTHVTGGDSSVCGGDWATDTYTRTLQFIPQSDGTINVVRTYDGTFVTLPQVPQPNGPCGEGPLQQGGVTGTFTGYDVYVVVGGTFNPNGVCAANCTSAAMRDAFFPGSDAGASGPVHGWEYHYDAGANGQWINSDPSRVGNVGNITG